MVDWDDLSFFNFWLEGCVALANPELLIVLHLRRVLGLVQNHSRETIVTNCLDLG